MNIQCNTSFLSNYTNKKGGVIYILHLNYYLSITNTVSVACSNIISSAATWAAAKRAINTRYGEQETYDNPVL